MKKKKEEPKKKSIIYPQKVYSLILWEAKKNTVLSGKAFISFS